MEFSTSVKILDQSLISPPPLSACESRPSLPLNFFDMLWLNYSPVERLFFYQFSDSSSHFIDFHLPNLKFALSATLSTFYPLAATIRRSRSDGRFEIAPAHTDSVPLTVTEYAGNPADFLDISGDHSRPVEKLLPLVPRLPMSRDAQPLLALQVTLFPYFGLCVSLAVHHSACDGFSSMQFVKLWSATAASSFRPDDLVPQLPAPVMDRTVIPDPRNLYLQMEKAVLDVRVNEKMITSGISGGVYAATFTLSAPEISRLKKEAQKKAEEQGIPCFHCSSFVVSCAYSWICLLKTRHKTDGEGKAHFVFAVDWRRRIQPPFPETSFGTCLSGCFVKWDAEELLAKDGILAACAAIGKAIEELGDAHESMDGVMDKLGEIAPWRPLSLAGSPKMGVYGTDFGWGKPRKVEVISTRETGAIAMAESRNGDGGIEVGVILPEDNLKAFADYFAGGMDR
ncbi:phenolic glucoside malonyltransferase 1-like [Phalaenopsis equestris]|uniref:phenolic glucoside malonyltransferase 1-like n=1 Tax=Phalaenopsis equestris TaxID=78828 RepID=UPI0009E5C00C|nr:phenolic glucoside malonyltransferase 1-like [Phalaenopsis equestris]